MSSTIHTELLLDWVNTGNTVLDVGCGDGSTLQWLIQRRQVIGYGIDRDPHAIQTCIDKGLAVIEHNLEAGLTRDISVVDSPGLFKEQSFDIALMKDLLHLTADPTAVLLDAAQIADHLIVVVRNFSALSVRLRYLRTGVYDKQGSEHMLLPFGIEEFESWLKQPRLQSVLRLEQIKYVGGTLHNLGMGLKPQLTATWAYCLLKRANAAN